MDRISREGHYSPTSAQDSSGPPRTRKVLDDRYELHEQIGQGRFAK